MIVRPADVSWVVLRLGGSALWTLDRCLFAGALFHGRLLPVKFTWLVLTPFTSPEGHKFFGTTSPYLSLGTKLKITSENTSFARITFGILFQILHKISGAQFDGNWLGEAYLCWRRKKRTSLAPFGTVVKASSQL